MTVTRCNMRKNKEREDDDHQTYDFCNASKWMIEKESAQNVNSDDQHNYKHKCRSKNSHCRKNTFKHMIYFLPDFHK